MSDNAQQQLDTEPQLDPREFLDDLIPRSEAAEQLRLKPSSMTRLHNRGTLPLTRYKRGRQVLYSRRQVAEHIQQGITFPRDGGSPDASAAPQ